MHWEEEGSLNNKDSSQILYCNLGLFLRPIPQYFTPIMIVTPLKTEDFDVAPNRIIPITVI